VDAVGGDTPVPIDVRIVAATNKDPQERIRAGLSAKISSTA